MCSCIETLVDLQWSPSPREITTFVTVTLMAKSARMNEGLFLELGVTWSNKDMLREGAHFPLRLVQSHQMVLPLNPKNINACQWI